jgi:uncharacterized protein YjeT (DUF2065 family)
MTQALALELATVGLAGLFLVALGLLSWARPSLAGRFLRGLAGTAARHYLELVVRWLIGLAFVHAAPAMPGAVVFALAGWVLVVTTMLMFLVPWQHHRRFAQWAVPMALPYLPLLGLAALAGGAAILWSLHAAVAA